MRSLLFAAVVALAVTPSLANAGEEVVIVAGHSQTLTVPFALGEGTNSNPKVLRTIVDPATRKITFFGIGTGAATYTVTDARSHSHMLTYEVRVVGEDLGRVQQDLQRQLDEIEGLDGDSPSYPCLEDPRPGCSGEPSSVTDANFCDTTPDVTPQARETCEWLTIALHDIEGVRVRAIGNDVRVEGEVATPEDYDRVEREIQIERTRD